MSGKSDNPRPFSVTPEQFAANFDAIDWNAREREARAIRFSGDDTIRVMARCRAAHPSFEWHCETSDFGYRIDLTVATLVSGEQWRLGGFWTASTGKPAVDAKLRKAYLRHGSHEAFLDWFADEFGSALAFRAAKARCKVSA